MTKWFLTGVAAAALAITGCSKSSSVNTAPIEKNFASADAATKSAADSVVASVKNADYAGALAGLQKLAADAKLTDAQKKAVSDVIDQVKSALSDAAGKAAGEAGKALEGVQKALPK